MDEATELLYKALKALLRKERKSAFDYLSILRARVECGDLPDVPTAVFELQKEPIPGWKRPR